MNENKDEILRQAWELKVQAEEKQSASLFDAAGNKFLQAGYQQNASDCFDKADELRKAGK